jgi:hypothetical protein
VLVASLGSCSIGQKTVKDQIEIDNEYYFRPDSLVKEVFRVFITSDRYIVIQMSKNDTIRRLADSGGDKYMCEELKKYDKMDEAREGIISVSLYPDSGKLMKVRSERLVNLIEIDNLLIEDIQRWNFEFPKNVVSPDKFDIKYRVVLQKKQTDEEIMREVRDKIKEKRVYR